MEKLVIDITVGNQTYTVTKEEAFALLTMPSLCHEVVAMIPNWINEDGVSPVSEPEN